MVDSDGAMGVKRESWKTMKAQRRLPVDGTL